MKALKDIFKTIALDLGRGRTIQATNGIVDALKALEERVEAIEARNREKDCICKTQDANGDFEIIKRIQAAPEYRKAELTVGDPESSKAAVKELKKKAAPKK